MNRKLILRAGLALGIAAVIVILCLLWYNNRIKPLLSAFAGAKAVTDTTAALNRAFTRAVPESIAYESLITVNRDADGQVTSLTGNTSELNSIKAEIVAAATDQLGKLPELRTDVNIGSLLPPAFLYGKGPSLTFYAFASEGLETEFANTFTSAGINYTLHRIVLTLKVKINVVMPGNVIEKEVSEDFFLAETVLSGGVPEIYLKNNG